VRARDKRAKNVNLLTMHRRMAGVDYIGRCWQKVYKFAERKSLKFFTVKCWLLTLITYICLVSMKDTYFISEMIWIFFRLFGCLSFALCLSFCMAGMLQNNVIRFFGMAFGAIVFLFHYMVKSLRKQMRNNWCQSPSTLKNETSIA
jgi:hypothetical protein